MILDTQYSRAYRTKIGLNSQADTKSYLSAKDISPQVDYKYIEQLLQRLTNIYDKLNNAIHPLVQHKNFNIFIERSIEKPYQKIKENGLILNLNNQGRRPEQVLFNWLRGYAATEFLKPALSHIFDISIDKIKSIGDDDFSSLDTFRRTPRADLSLPIGNETIRLEVQAGFQGINDVKQHKWLEAKRVLAIEGQHTLCVHGDFFNGQVAFIRLSTIPEDDVHWITRQQMEGQTVFNIDQNQFSWGLMHKPSRFHPLNFT